MKNTINYKHKNITKDIFQMIVNDKYNYNIKQSIFIKDMKNII